MVNKFDGPPNLELEYLINRLDIGTKERRGSDRLYLAFSPNTIYGGVEFQIKGTKIIGPDGAEFDLANMNYHGNAEKEGIFRYLKIQSGELRPDSDNGVDLELLN